MAEIGIVGAGILGLLSARRLAAQGHQVTLWSAPQRHPPASWAGGGILSALFPWRHPDALTRLTRHALADYQQLSAALAQEGWPGLELVESGLLMPGVADTATALSWAARWDLAARVVSAAEHCGRFHDEHALWIPSVGQLRNPRALKALAASNRRAGVHTVDEPVQRFVAAGAGWAVQGAQHSRRVDQLLLCSGAGTAGLVQRSTGRQLPLFPARGEMLCYAPGIESPPCIILREQGYVIPRADGTLLVGSTLTESADGRPTAGGGRVLQGLAETLWPPLAGRLPFAQWAGIRPGCRASVPILSELPEAPGVFVASGHFRNGLVAAPASAALVTALMAGTAAPFDPAPYALSSSLSPP